MMGIEFRTVLIDEASQTTEPETIVPLVHGTERVILVGDHLQLQPVVISLQAKACNYDRSLFERLITLGMKTQLLSVQYRMHPALSEFSSNAFYDGALQNGIHASERTRNFNFPWPRSDKPMMFWAASGSEDPGSSGRSLQNRVEANYVEAVVARLFACGVQGSRIGVITPYDSQRSLFMQMFNRHSSKADDQFKMVEVASVDEFQGREKDYIVFSCVRSNSIGVLGFLTDYRRLNVALTRAKYGIVIVGDPNTLKCDDMWSSLLAYYQREKCLVCGAALDSLSPYLVTINDKNKPFLSRRLFDLANRMKKQTKNYIGPDSSILLGLNTTAEGAKDSSALKSVRSRFVDERSDYFTELPDFDNADTGI